MSENHSAPYAPPAARLEEESPSGTPRFTWLATVLCSLSTWLYLFQDPSGHFDEGLARFHTAPALFLVFVAITLAVVLGFVLGIGFVVLVILKALSRRNADPRGRRKVVFWLKVVAADILFALVVLNWITAT